MVVISGAQLTLQPYETVGPVSVIAGCTSLELEVPDSTDMLLAGTPAGGDLGSLMCLEGLQECSFRIQQLAIWTITDDLGRNSKAYCGGGGKITDEEQEEIRAIFEEAGILPEDYRVLQPVVYVELLAAARDGLVAASANGTGSINRIKIGLASQTEDILKVSILPGTIFTASAAGVQSMVVVIAEEVLLDPYEAIEPFYVDAACANMELDAPGSDSSLQLSGEAPPGTWSSCLNWRILVKRPPVSSSSPSGR
jgi:hypothetical protein